MKQKVYIIIDKKSGKGWSRHDNFTSFPIDVAQYLNEEVANSKKDLLQKMFPETQLEKQDVLINV